MARKTSSSGVARPAPSLSKSALVLSPCLAWANPDAEHYDDRFSDTTKRDRGTEFHRRIHQFGTDDAGAFFIPNGDTEMYQWVQAGADYLTKVLIPRCESVQYEVAIAVNFPAGAATVLERVKDREYPPQFQKDGWQCGTADLVCILKDGSLLIADWKTGGTEGAKEQLLSLAYGFSLCMPLSERNGTIRPVRVACLKVFPGGIDPDERSVSPEELALHRDAMAFKIQDLTKGPSKPVAGIHCTTLYCPHLAFCGAVGGIVEEAAEGPNGLLAPEALTRHYRMTDKPSSDAEAGHVMARVSAAKRQLDYYTNAMKDYVAKGGRAICGQYEWSQGKDGFRWRKM